MTHEMTMLGWAALLGLVYIATAGAFSNSQRGMKWNVGNRDGEVAPLVGAAARASRAVRNFLETFAVFAAAVLGVAVAGKTSNASALGADLYFWARLLYLPTYILGVPYLRSAVWTVSLVGIIMELHALLH